MISTEFDDLLGLISPPSRVVGRMTRRLLISFSGGETSAYMTQWLLRNWRDRYDEIVILFANTGQENEQTLVFVDQCDRLIFAPLGHRVVWIEAVQHHGVRKAAGFRVVDFSTADRDGDVFEDMIRKYGLPNPDFKHCTRDLKLAPITSYCRSVGWEAGSYDTAIGIRADEIDRMAINAAANRLIYPLVKAHPRTKPHINAWWALTQAFRLQLKGYQGNCRWCWKKSMRKHLTIIAETSEAFDFPRRMEATYPNHGAEFRQQQAGTLKKALPEGHRRVFFRKHQSVEDLFAIYEEKKGTLIPAEDDAAVFDPDLDVGGGCEESCEVWSEEDRADVDERPDLFAPLPTNLPAIFMATVAF